MAFKFKKNPIGLFDMLRTKHMAKKRQKMLSKGSLDELPASDNVQDLAHQLHHPMKDFKVIEVVPFNDEIITFKFAPVDGSKLAFFKPGQYIAIQIKENDILVTRPFTLSSSPNDAYEKGYYQVTIKKLDKGLFTTWMFKNAKVGTVVKISSPLGDFAYNPIRDKKHIVCLAGGTGITPFVSMAKSIIYGSMKNVKMTLFHGIKSMEEGVWVEQLQEMAKLSDHFEYIPVSEKQEEKIKERGFISRELVEKYVKDEYTIFACGSNGFYNYLLKEFRHLDRKDLRTEKNIIGWREVSNLKKHKIKVHVRDEIFEITCLNSQTVLSALEEHHIDASNRCRVGHCGYCHAKCLSGKYTMVLKSLRAADKDFDYFHPCCSYPETDLEIIVNSNK